MAERERWSEESQRWRIMEQMEEDREQRQRWAMQSAGSVSEREDVEGRLDDRFEGGHRGRGPKGYKRSDSRIEEEIHARLADHPDLDATAVSFRVENGEVMLGGEVDSRAARRLAEDIVEDVGGVTLVMNSLRVRERGRGPAPC